MKIGGGGTKILKVDREMLGKWVGALKRRVAMTPL